MIPAPAMPYVFLALGIGYFASVGATFWFGMGVGANREIAKQAKVEAVVAAAAKAFAENNATLISEMRPKYTTIYRKLEHEIHHHEVYRECKHPDDALRMLNDIVSGRVDPAAARALLRRHDGAGAGVRGDDEAVRTARDPAPRVPDIARDLAGRKIHGRQP